MTIFFSVNTFHGKGSFASEFAFRILLSAETEVLDG
jgi:hypothetical protein